MAERTLTRAHLSEAVYEEVGLSRNESTELVESVLNKISSTLVEGETVKVSSFGTFSVRSKGQELEGILRLGKRFQSFHEEYWYFGHHKY